MDELMKGAIEEAVLDIFNGIIPLEDPWETTKAVIVKIEQELKGE